MLAVLFPSVRHPRTLITIALTTTIGIVIWNTLLNVTYATWLNVDSPFLGLCVQDVGSGVGAFLVTALVLRFVTNKAEPVGRVLAASAVVGLARCWSCCRDSSDSSCCIVGTHSDSTFKLTPDIPSACWIRSARQIVAETCIWLGAHARSRCSGD